MMERGYDGRKTAESLALGNVPALFGSKDNAKYRVVRYRWQCSQSDKLNDHHVALNLLFNVSAHGQSSLPGPILAS